jgi:hypothetical protein
VLIVVILSVYDEKVFVLNLSCLKVSVFMFLLIKEFDSLPNADLFRKKRLIVFILKKEYLYLFIFDFNITPTFKLIFCKNIKPTLDKIKGLLYLLCTEAFPDLTTSDSFFKVLKLLKGKGFTKVCFKEGLKLLNDISLLYKLLLILKFSFKFLIKIKGL